MITDIAFRPPYWYLTKFYSLEEGKLKYKSNWMSRKFNLFTGRTIPTTSTGKSTLNTTKRRTE